MAKELFVGWYIPFAKKIMSHMPPPPENLKVICYFAFGNHVSSLYLKCWRNHNMVKLIPVSISIILMGWECILIVQCLTIGNNQLNIKVPTISHNLMKDVIEISMTQKVIRILLDVVARTPYISFNYVRPSLMSIITLERINGMTSDHA